MSLDKNNNDSKKNKKEQEIIPLSSDPEHIKRHFSESTTVGSKLFSKDERLVVDKTEEAMMTAFYQAQDNAREAALASGKDEEPVGRIVITLNFDNPIGTDSLANLASNNDKNQVSIIRDQGTPGESIVTAIETTDIPETNKLTIIAGPYGPTGKWGIYTMFPGAEAPPFPNDKQPDEVKASNEKFWNEHGFLATQEEIKSHPRADGQEHDFKTKANSPKMQNKGYKP